MADPGFPIWGDLRSGHLLVKMYAKMKELGPVEEGRSQGSSRLRSANGH